MHAMMRPEKSPSPSLPPGFRFHPTDEELILHYLKNRSSSLPCPVAIIAEVDIYKYNPWDLPAMAAFGDTEWYFFTPRDRKYPNGIRPNRAAASGYWKATGTDKPITTAADPGARSSGSVNIGVKKALVFYRGKPPKGTKTSWIMHEYRLTTDSTANNNFRHLYRPPKVDGKDVSMRLDDWVLCRIYKKTNHLLVRRETEYRRREEEEEEEEGGRNSQGLVGDPYMANLGSTNVDYIFPRPPSLTELVQNNEMMSHLLHQIPPASEHARNPNYDQQLPQILHGPSDQPERGENDNGARFSGMNHPNTSGSSTSGNFNNQLMIDAFNHPFHYLQNLK